MNEKTLAAIALSNRDYDSFDDKLAEAGKWVAFAATQGADLAVLPELLNRYCGDGAGNPKAIPLQDLAMDDWQAACAPLLDAARRAEIAVVVPVLVREGDALLNCFYFVSASGSVLGRYCKMFPTPDELDAGVLPHGPQPLIEWEGLKVGGAICFDTRFDETFAAQQNADLFVIPSLWPGGTSLVEVARRCAAPIVLAYPAWSRIIGMDGQELAAAGYRNETLRFGFGSPVAMATVNFDRMALWANLNQQKIVDVQEALCAAARVTFDQPNCMFYLESRTPDQHVADMADRFGLVPADQYHADCLRQRNEALASVAGRQSPIESVRTLVADGRHNAFTDLHRFKGNLFLTFRRSSGHGETDGDVVILRSGDEGSTWTQITSPASQTQNFYEGHLVELNGRLLMYSGAFQRGGRLNKLTQQEWVSWTDDGINWHGPEKAYDARWRFWRPIEHDGTLYAAAYQIDYTGMRHDGYIPPELWTVKLIRSTDGLHWEPIATISNDEGGNETELFVDEQGVMHAFVRCAERPCHLRHRSASVPFTEWGRSKDCGFNAEGQQIKTINGRTFLIARSRPSDSRVGTIYERRDLIRTKIWVKERDFWVDYATLPSGGDTSYAALLPLDESRMLVSYYSQHEYVEQPGFEDMGGASNIYLAVVRTDASADWGRLTSLGRKALREQIDVRVGMI